MGEQVGAGILEKISESCFYIHWFLPVIKDQKHFWFLMTDKYSQLCTLKTAHREKDIKKRNQFNFTLTSKKEEVKRPAVTCNAMQVVIRKYEKTVKQERA